MPIPITMPRLSDTMEEGTLIKWRVKVGDQVGSGDLLADVETGKATMELQAFDEGTIARLVIDEGETLPVGGMIAVLAEAGETLEEAASAAIDETHDDAAAVAPPLSAAQQQAAPANVPTITQAATAAADPQSPGSLPGSPPETDRVRSSPVARKLAEQNGIDLGKITGSGPDGRIIKKDVLAAVAAAATPAPLETIRPEARSLPLSNMRKTIARRLVESKTTIPHFTVTVSVNMDPLLDLRAALNPQLEPEGVKLSVNDFVVRASAEALVRHPVCNSSWADDSIRRHGTVNIGVAVALTEDQGGGLVVPTLRDTPNLSLRQISAATRALAQKARSGSLTPEEMSDGTFTISNLGMLGVDHFEAIINPPQAAILAVGAAMQKPVVRDGQVVAGREMTCTLSCDHRVIDGAQAAEFLRTLKGMLENPALMLV